MCIQRHTPGMKGRSTYSVTLPMPAAAAGLALFVVNGDERTRLQRRHSLPAANHEFNHNRVVRHIDNSNVRSNAIVRPEVFLRLE